MDDKTTTTLLNELQSTKNVYDFINQNQNNLKTYPLPEYLNYLLHEKNCTKSEIIKRSGLNQIYAYHIFSGNKKPSRKKVISLALAFQLTFKEAQILLKCAHISELYIRNPWDSIIIYALNQHLNVLSTNELLMNLTETSFLE